MVFHGIKDHILVRFKSVNVIISSCLESNKIPLIYPDQLQRDQQVTINKVLDQTRQNIKKSVNEAKKDISIYAEQTTNLQERSIDATRDIAKNYIDSQNEIINSFNQTVWDPYVGNIVNKTTGFPEVFPYPERKYILIPLVTYPIIL